MTKLKRAYLENRLERQLQQLIYPRLLILGEIGYLPMSEEASLCFRLVARRCEKASIVPDHGFGTLPTSTQTAITGHPIPVNLSQRCTALTPPGADLRMAGRTLGCIEIACQPAVDDLGQLQRIRDG